MASKDRRREVINAAVAKIPSGYFTFVHKDHTDAASLKERGLKRVTDKSLVAAAAECGGDVLCQRTS